MADFNETLDELNNTKDTTGEFDAQDVQNNKVMGILAYISWLVLIPLLAAKGSKFARFHVNQGLVLAITEIAVVFVCGILAGLPLIGWLFGIVRSLICLACFICAVLGIINAANGRAKELPIVGSIKILK